jgi:hypothetical protein
MKLESIDLGENQPEWAGSRMDFQLSAWGTPFLPIPKPLILLWVCAMLCTSYFCAYIDKHSNCTRPRTVGATLRGPVWPAKLHGYGAIQYLSCCIRNHPGPLRAIALHPPEESLRCLTGWLARPFHTYVLRGVGVFWIHISRCSAQF